MGYEYQTGPRSARRRTERIRPQHEQQHTPPQPQAVGSRLHAGQWGLEDLTPDAVLALQRSAGNAAVNQLLRAVAPCGTAQREPFLVRSNGAGPDRTPPGVLQRHPVAPEPDGEEDADLKREQEAEEEARTGALQRTVQPASVSRAHAGDRAPRPVIQRKTRRGGTLPEGAGLVDARVDAWVTLEKERLAPAVAARSLTDAQENLETLWTSATRGSAVGDELTGSKAFLEEELTKPHADLDAALTAVGGKIDAAVREAQAQKASARKGAPAPMWGNRDNVTEARKALDRFKNAAQDHAARQESVRLRRLLSKQEELRQRKPSASLGDAFLAVRAETGLGLKQGYVPRAEKAGFAKALLELPAVRFILGRKDKAARPGASGAKVSGAKTSKVRLAASPAPQWKDGGSLADPALRRAEDDALRKGRTRQRVDDNATLTRRLGKADTLVKHMAGRAVLSDIDRPTFTIHTKGAQSPTNWTGQRAFHAKGDISLGYDTPTNVIMHEVGHVLEDHLPDAWHDTRLLLDKRHEEAGGGGARRGPVGPTMLSEGTYGGTYVTGRYTATANDSGGSEVFSQAMEYFTSPKTARELIDGDPLHAAIILRALDPVAYGKVEALRSYDRYLPSGYGVEREMAPVPATPESRDRAPTTGTRETAPPPKESVSETATT